MIAFYADEDIPYPLVKALRRQQIQVTTTQESRMLGKTDEEQLHYAASRQLVLLTHNTRDFVKLHTLFQKEKKLHAGIVVSKKGTVGILLRKLLHLASALRVEDMKDRIEYLYNW